jgi:hypothetical protein
VENKTYFEEEPESRYELIPSSTRTPELNPTKQDVSSTSGEKRSSQAELPDSLHKILTREL